MLENYTLLTIEMTEFILLLILCLEIIRKAVDKAFK